MRELFNCHTRTRVSRSLCYKNKAVLLPFVFYVTLTTSSREKISTEKNRETDRDGITASHTQDSLCLSLSHSSSAENFTHNLFVKGKEGFKIAIVESIDGTCDPNIRKGNQPRRQG